MVGDRGEYSQPTLGAVSVGGKTTATVVAELQSILTGVLVKPEVTVSIIKIAAVRVNVVGEVKTPGSYELTRSRGVMSALATAGWLTEFANKDRIFVIRTRGDGARNESDSARPTSPPPSRTPSVSVCRTATSWS